MNVGILFPALKKKGPVNGLYNRLSTTTDESVQYFIYTFKRELPDNSRKGDFDRLGIPVTCLYDKNAIQTIFKLRKVLKEDGIELIEVHGFRCFLFSWFMKIKKISVVHADYYTAWPLDYGWLGYVCAGIENMLLKRCDTIICCARYLVPLVRKYTRHKNIVPVLNSTLTRISALERNPPSKKETVTYIYVGSIDKRKGVKKLCEQFSKYALLNERLLCIGSGPDVPAIQEKKYRNIRLSGFVDDVTPFLLRADYFISLSVSEGLPNAVIEALACGLPVLLSDIPAHREFFELNDRIGVLAPNGLDDALPAIRDKNYTEMSQEAYHTYLRYLTPQRMEEGYVEQFRLLLQGKGIR